MTAGSAVHSVQASLYVRLKKRYVGKSGDVAWLLVRLAQHDHPQHSEARDVLLNRGIDELRELGRHVAATRDSPTGHGNEAWGKLARSIFRGLEELVGQLEATSTHDARLAARTPAQVTADDLLLDKKIARFEALKASGLSYDDAMNQAEEEAK